MSRSTPSSLKWLINKQTRLVGEILRKRDHIEQFREQIAICKKEIAGLQAQQSQIEAVMRMHEIKLNARELRPIRPHHNLSVLGHGGLTRLIYTTLRQTGKGTATTRDIVVAVSDALGVSLSPDQMEHVKKRVRVRLCIMARRGMLTKSPRRGPCEPCSWHLLTEHPPGPSRSPDEAAADDDGGYRRDSHASTLSNLAPTSRTRAA